MLTSGRYSLWDGLTSVEASDLSCHKDINVTADTHCHWRHVSPHLMLPAQT